jgi:hypothetical protein
MRSELQRPRPATERSRNNSKPAVEAGFEPARGLCNRQVPFQLGYSTKLTRQNLEGDAGLQPATSAFEAQRSMQVS